MAILNNLIVNGSSRFLNTAYFQDVSIDSLSLSGNLSVTGTSTLTGHVSIGGYNNASYGLSASSAIINSWIRTTGSTGWYNESHGGGWYMTDNNYVRSYNKPVMMGHNMFFGSTSYYVHTDGAANFSTVSSSTANIATLNANNASVTNNLHASHFDLQTVAQLGGSFYVSPTLKFPNSGTTLKVEKSSTQLTLTIKDSSISTGTMAGIAWTSGSAVKVSGTINGIVTGTMDGTINSITNGSQMVVKVSGGNWNSVQATTTDLTASEFSDLTVMVYQRHVGSSDYRVGIWMNCYDHVNSSSTIRVYGGTDANPTVTIGNLTGMTFNGNLIEGTNNWGILTSMGYFEGAVISNEGQIGGWTIDENKLFNGTDSMTSTVPGTYIGAGTTAANSGIRNYASSTQYVNITGGKITALGADIRGEITATSGTIGGVTANSSYGLYTNSKTSATSTNTGFLISKDGAIYLGAYNSTNKACPFQVTSAGALTATSGKIGGWTIGASSLYSGTHSAYNSNVDGIFMDSTYLAGGKQAMWYLKNDGSAKIGALTLSSAGVLAVPAANITGTLTASQIGANQITAEKLSVTVGGNNLLRNSHQSISNGDYAFGDWYFGPNPPQEGDLVTFQLKGTLASTKTEFRVYNSGGNVTPSGTNSLTYDSSTGIYSATFNWRITQGSYTASNTFLRVYAFTSSQSGTSSCEWVKLEYGDVATPWSPSPDEAGGFDIDNTSIHTANVAVTSNADNSIALSSADFTRTISGTSRTGLRFAIGDKFGVTGDGTIYAGSANISGTLTAGNGSTIGDLTIANGKLSVPAANITGTLSADHIDASSLQIGQSQVTNLTTDLGNKASSSDLTALSNKVTAVYGESNPSSTNSSEQVKVVTCSNFVLFDGALITVKFAYGSTYSSGAVQLNINSTGAKNIWVANAVTSSTNKLLWRGGAVITFRYDGSAFIVVGEPREWYGTCSTAASTSAKVVTDIAGCVVCKGTTVSLYMTNENTATSPYLNVGYTGNINLYAGNGTTRPTTANGFGWVAGSAVSFIFDGQYWRVGGSSDAARTATNYISTIGSTGINVSYATNANNYLQITGDGVSIYKDINGTSTQIANYGSSIILGKLAADTTHVEIDSDSFDVCYGVATGSSAIRVATFGEITRIGNGGSNVLIDGSGFSFTNTDGVEMMKISTDNVVIGKDGSSYFYVDSNSITLKDNDNADVFKVESGGGVTGTETYTERRGAKFQGNELNNGCNIQRDDNGVRSPADKVWIRFYKKYTYQVIIEGTAYTRTGLRLIASEGLPSTYYQSGYEIDNSIFVFITGGNNGGTKFINNLVDQYCDSTDPTFDIMFSATYKSPSYANLNMDGNMVVTGSIAADKIQSDEIEATGSLTAPGLIFSSTGKSINEIQYAAKSVVVTSSNSIDHTPAIGAQLTLHSGIYLLIGYGNFPSSTTAGQRITQIAIYSNTNPTDANILKESRVRIVNAYSYWTSLKTTALVTVPFNTGQTYTVGLTASLGATSSSSTSLYAIYLQPTYPDPDD